MTATAQDVAIKRGNPPRLEKTLRELFLTLFLRGRSARGLRKGTAPRFVATKLWTILIFYALFGLFSLALARQPLLTLSIYLHASTFVFVGMYVASSCGEMLFNKEEADILLHRPIEPGVMLRAKITVLVQVSLWMSMAFNLAGLFTGVFSRDGTWLFPIAHMVSIVIESIFCASFVVVAYQLCLRWFGRERLDGLMTTVQVLVSIGLVTAGQILPRLLPKIDAVGDIATTWWFWLLPPAWFAGIDVTMIGRGSISSFVFALVGVAATAGLVFVALKILAGDYELGLQNLGAVSTETPNIRSRRWIDAIANAPPLSWWLRDPAERAVFILCTAYMVRDRDTKLRLYPGLAPTAIVPIVFAFQDRLAGFSFAFIGAFLAQIPTIALSLLRYSQQWRAADLFRVAPIFGPGPICHGARKAVVFLLSVPAFCVLAICGVLLHREAVSLLMLVPGLIMLPVLSLIPGRDGDAIPLSQSIEEAQSTRRGLFFLFTMLGAIALSGVAFWAQQAGWLGWFLIGESVVMIGLYVILRSSTDASVWSMIE